MGLPSPVDSYIEARLTVDFLCQMNANYTCKYPVKMNHSHLDNIQ